MALNFIKKETLALVFSCEFCGIFKNTFSKENLWVTASNWSPLVQRSKKTKLNKKSNF